MKSLYSFFSSVNSASNVKLSESLAANSSKNLLNKFILRTAGLVALFLFLGGSVWGQVSNYSFTSASGSWSPVTAGGTYISALAADDAGSTVTIPFTFKFNNVDYTQASIRTNGIVRMGGTGPATGTTGEYVSTSNSNGIAISTSDAASVNLLCAFSMDLNVNTTYTFTGNRTSGSNQLTSCTGANFTTTKVRPGMRLTGTGIPTGAYVVSVSGTTVTISANATSNGTSATFTTGNGFVTQTIGSAPNRTFILQWSGFKRYTLSDDIDFQVRLNETTNTIQFVYNFVTVATSATAGTSDLSQIGLKGASNADFLNRTTTSNWTSTSLGTVNTATVLISNVVKPQSGLTYTFTPPVPAITVVGSITSFSTCQGMASTAQSFTVSGANMTAGITLTPPVGFEVSTSSTFASNVGTNASPITVGAAGTIASTTIYVRLQNSATGNPSGNIALTSTGATTQNVSVSGTVNSTSNPAGTISNDAAACGNVTLSYSSPDASVYWQTSPTGTSTSSPTTSSYSLASSGTIYARAYNSTTGCWSSGTVNSGAITVSPLAPPTISIAASPSGAICAGTNVTFTSTVTTGGSSPAFEWYLNGVQVGTGSTYSSSTLVNGDQVYCFVTSNSSCAPAGQTTATSATTTMSVLSLPTTQATIGSCTNNNSGTGLTVNWTRGNGNTGVIVVARATATAAVNPSGGTSYTANATFGSGTGTEITGTGNYVVYVGTGTSVAVSGLAGNTNYTFTVYEYSNSCYLTPGSSSSVSTPLENALSFDGTDDRVNCGTASSIDITGTAITLEAWIYPTAWKTNVYQGNIVNREAPGTAGYMLRCGNSGQLSFNFGSGSAWVELLSATNALTLNTWQHVAGTYDGTTLRLYKNGVLLTSSSSTASIASATTSQQLTIGNWSQDNTRGFQGLIDEVRIWNVARNASELNCGMTEVPDLSNSALKARYSFNQGVANGTNTGVTTLTDATSNANTGTLTNFTLTGTSSNWVVGKSGIQSASACSGTPNPGATTTSAATVNSTSTVVTLGLTNATCGTGVTYQWQSSTDGTNYTNVSGATNSTYSTTISTSTYFKCNVICAGSTGTSTAVLVTLTYCTPSYTNTVYYINGFSTSGGISNIVNTSGTTPLTNSYSNYSAQSCSQNPGSSINYSIPLSASAASGGAGLAIYVDWNNNWAFEASERMTPTLTAYVYATYSGNFVVPANTASGNYRMRVVLDYNAYTPAACALSASNGEFEDYTFSVVIPSISTNGSTSAFSNCSGSVSTSQSFTVSGTNLGASLVVTAPTGFQVSTTQNGTYTSSVSFTPSSGTVSSQTVWVRLSATATGSPSGNIAVSSTGGTTQNIAVSGTVNTTPTAVTVTGGAICSGGTITATGGTGGTIYWQGTTSGGTSTTSGSGTTSPAITSAGTYYARAQSSEGCWGTEGSASVTLTPIPSCISAGFIPADASSSVNPVSGTTISWSAVLDATSYDVYFGTDNTPTNIANGVTQSGLSYVTGSLTENTTYYWKVVPKNCNGSASTCSVYSFTTTASCTPPAISSISNVNINCFNQSTGSITVNATGGVTGYEYSKDNGTTWQASNIFGSLAAGTYTVLVKGGDGCIGAPSFTTLTQPASALSVSASGSGSGCEGSTLSLTSSVSGGTGPYTYSWSNAGGLSDGSVANPTATIGSYASHTLTVTDANGCTASSSVPITNNSPAAPTVVTPDAICQGQSANLNATSSGNSINWYTTSSGGTAVASLVNSGANYSVSPVTSTTYYAEAVVTTPGSQSFSYIGSIVNWTVPAGVSSITVNAKGASGGYYTGATAGKGANMTGTFSVTPGQVLSILVGQSPGSTTLYAAGGGGTFVALGSSYTTATPLIVAGGGGGAYSGGTGTDAPITTSGTGSLGGVNGSGASAASCSGGGGGFYTSGANDTYSPATSGGAGFRQGGAGGAARSTSYQAGGFGGGAGANYAGSCNTTAGNGGGYSGGGGQGTGSVSGGNAGGSFNSGTSQNNIAGNNVGNGSVTITYSIQGCASARTPLVVTVNEAPTANAGAALSAICQGQTSAAMGGSIGGTATSGTWSGGAGTWTNANDPANATYTAGASESGTITLTLTPSGGSCPSITATKTIVVNALPTVTFTTSPASAICSATSATYTTQSGQTNYVWDVPGTLGTDYTVGSGGTGSTNNTVTINWLTSGSKTVTVNYTNANGCTAATAASSTTVVTISPTASVAGSAQAICANATATLSANTPTVGTGAWTVASGPSTLTTQFSSTSNPSAVFTPAGGAGSYVLTWTISNGTCSSSSNVSVTVNPVPSAIAISPTSSTLCFGNNTSLAASNASSVVTIGTQVSTSVAANTPYRQSTGAANQSRVQYLITKAEMNSAGISGPTTISSLGFNVTAAGTGTISTYTIGMVNSNLTSLTSTYQAPTFTNVYSGTNILPVVGINTHSFQTPFNWDGTSNILINICHQGAGGTVSTVSVYTPTVTSTTSGGGANQCSLTTGGVTNTSKPVMYLGTYVTNNISWLPLTELYTDAAATTAYTGTAAATVYAKPTTTTTYTATATSAAGCTSSNTVQVTVNPTSVAGTASSDQTICSGVTPTALSLSGNTGTIQWQSSTTSSTAGFANIAGETSATLTLGALTTTTYYRAVVTSGVCSSANSNVVTITVNAIPSAPVVTVVDNCDETSTLSTTATGTLAWSNSASTSSITVSTAGTYTVTQSVNGCTSAAGSGVAAPKSTPSTPSVTVTNECGLSTLSFTPDANTTILWSNNATTSSTTTTSSETLTVVQTVNGCPSAVGSGSAAPLVIPSAPTATASQNFCVTDNATVGSLAYTSVAGNTYTWYDAATAGNTVATSTQLPTATTTYYLSTSGSNGCISLTRTAVAATEAAQALASVSITGGTSCEGTAITFTATPTNGGTSPTYQWYNGGVPILNETGNTYIATGLAEGAVITVKMIPSGSCVTVCP